MQIFLIFWRICTLSAPAATLTFIILSIGIQPSLFNWSPTIRNANGDSFELKTSVTAVKPFRAYFVSNEATGGSSIPALLPTEGLTITGFVSPLDEYDEIQLISTGKGTYCSSFDLNFANVEGLNAYITSGYDDKTNIIWLTRVKSVPAGTGIVLKGEPNGHYQVPRAESRSYYANMLVGNYGEAYQIESTTDDYKNFVMKGGQFVGIEAGTTATVGKNRAYLQIPSRIFAGTRSVSIGYDDGNGTTSVDRIIEHETQEDGVFYNLQGQRVEKPGKGLYIKNGKKVIVR